MNKQIKFFLRTIGVLIMFAQSAWAVTCTSTSKADWKSGTWTGCTTVNSNPPAGANVVIAATTEIKVDTNPPAVADITVSTGATLKIQNNNTLTFTGNLNVNGTFTAQPNSTVALTGTNQTISGAVTLANLVVAAGTQITLAGNITVSGTITGALNIVPNTSCPPAAVFTITNSAGAVVGNSCTGNGPYTGGGGGGGGGGACNSLLPALPPGGFPPLASGSVTTVGAGTNVNGVPVTQTAGTNTVLSPGSTATWSSGSSALPPPPSPIPTITTLTAVGAGGLAAGSYGDVRVTTGVGVFTGGNYFINELYVAPGATAQLAPGDYYVNKLTVGSSITKTGGTITLSGAGLVRIFVTTNTKGDVALYGGSSGIWDGSSINTGGVPANLQILLYDTVNYFEIGTNTQLTGFVVQPVYGGTGATSAIDVHQGATITGAVYTAGPLKIGKNVNFNYTPAVQNAITNVLTSCTNKPHHFEIQHADGQGVTCTASTLTIKACADGANPCTPYTAGVSGTLSATGTPTVNWGGASAAFTIPAGSSTITKDIQVTTVGSVTLDATSTPVPVAATTCSWGTCSFTSASSALLVSAPNHLAESASTLTIQAVKAAPGNPLVCTPGMTGTKTVNLKCGYTNPTTGTLPVRVAGAALNAANSAATACDASGANVSLTFNASGIATPSLQYADVGQMSVSASNAGTAGTIDAGLVMTGSGSFITAPASFSVTSVTAGPIKTGTVFSATVTALNAAGNATPNFGKETAPEGVTLSSVLAMGAGTWANPALGGTAAIPGASFTNGVATVSNLTWGEVGNINLNAALTSGNYLAGGLVTASGTSATSTQFIPEHYTTEIVSAGSVPMVCPDATCPANAVGASGMVYSGQPFTVKVTAKNLSGATTSNYQNAYAQDVTLSGVSATAGNLSNPLLLAGNFTAGVATTTSLPAFTFTAAGPAAPANVAIHAVGTGVSSAIVSAVAGESSLKVAYGRIKLPNAYGSELLPLTLSASAQYFGATGWTNSLTDNATVLGLAANYVVGTGSTTPTPQNGTITGGRLAIQLSRPGVRGVAMIVPAAHAYMGLVSGVATFGVYRGTNEFIYLREL